MNKNAQSSILAVLFDFDGTLTKPGSLNLSEIREIIECPAGKPILEFITSFPEEKSARQMAILDEFELKAAENAIANEGAEELIAYLLTKDVKVGIISRNTRASIECALQNFKQIRVSDFHVIISRDDPVRPKPHPDGILLAADQMSIPPDQIMMVGDYIFDVEAGKNANALTVFLDNGSSEFPDLDCDFRVSSLSELKDIIRLYIPLSPGKFPNDLLKSCLEQFDFKDPSVIINPGIGEDIAAIDIKGQEVMILKSDPITFATDAIAHYAVLVNANDIATSGAIPRWLLTTLLFPCGSTAVEIFKVMQELTSVCRIYDITLCGGHTEITDAVTRPLISGMLAGTVLRSGLIDKRKMMSGDKILLTKAVAVEGTSIVAREFAERLKRLGMTDEDIQSSREFLSYISILTEAKIAAQCPGTHAMHDVTEGGLSTALEELSIAGGHKLKIYMDKIPIFPQTEQICRLFNINPLGLIGSGSLIIACEEKHCEALIRQIGESDIQVTQIGEVLEKGQGIEAVRDNKPVLYPRFEVDEITRLF